MDKCDVGIDHETGTHDCDLCRHLVMSLNALARQLAEALQQVHDKAMDPNVNDPDVEHFLHDIHKPYHFVNEALAAAKAAGVT